jgi:polygalacturonase
VSSNLFNAGHACACITRWWLPKLKPLLSIVCFSLLSLPLAAAEFNVRDYGAAGDGVTLDSPAINAAIDAAAKAGGGTVVLPPGTYLSFSIRLKTNITLRIETNAILLAATPSAELGQYDVPEPNQWGDHFQYQDFGHSHWHNSLIWGEDVENVAITGGGLINGKALLRNASYRNGPVSGPNGTLSLAARDTLPISAAAQPAPLDPVGQGNKAIAFKNSRKIVIRDISILMGGHFAVLVTGVDDLVINKVTIDTNRDGMDIDASQNVRISDCRVNSPNDDAIVLKTSFALGALRDTRNVSISHCTVSGFDVGTLLDSTRGRSLEKAPDRDGPTARIKIGTESNGGFRNISIHDCLFERSRGLALETVDGGVIEDVTVNNLTMREVSNTPIFLRLGNRARGPATTPVGKIRRVSISNVTVEDADSRYAAILLSGLPAHAIEDISLDNIRIAARGGLTTELVAEQPETLVNAFFLRGTETGLLGPRDPLAVPEHAQGYPEPSMFGLLPANAIYARHARNLHVSNLHISFMQPDARPHVVLEDVDGATLERVDIKSSNTPAVVLRKVRNLTIKHSIGLRDMRQQSADELRF